MTKVLIGVDPHKASLAVAAVDQATGELLERYPSTLEVDSRSVAPEFPFCTPTLLLQRPTGSAGRTLRTVQNR